MANHKPLAWHFDGGCIRCTSHGSSPKGYVQYRVKGQGGRLLRHILFKRYGKQPTKVVSRHTCDNRWCINPDHIIPGSILDNARDRVERGNNLHGTQLPQTKLLPEQVIEIRRSNLSSYKAAEQFGIGATQVRNIRNRKWWRHLP